MRLQAARPVRWGAVGKGPGHRHLAGGLPNCPPGSGSGPGKRSGRKAGTAPRADFHRPDPAQVTALLDEHPRLGVEPVLRELHIASSTYYRWRRAEREPCEHRRRDAELTEQIKEIHAGSGGIYGSPRVPRRPPARGRPRGPQTGRATRPPGSWRRPASCTTFPSLAGRPAPARPLRTRMAPRPRPRPASPLDRVRASADMTRGRRRRRHGSVIRFAPRPSVAKGHGHRPPQRRAPAG